MTAAERLVELQSSGQLVCDAAAVGAVLDMSAWSVQRSVREGTFPIEPIRISQRRVVFRVADLARLVGAA